MEEITPDEKYELSGLIQNANNQVVSDLLNEEWEKTSDNISVLSSSEAEIVLQQIIGEKLPEIKRIYLFEQTWFRIAAAVLFMMGLFVIYQLSAIQNKKESELVHNEIIKQDIAPGGSRAILTLADGKTIILDSAQNGLLSSQGNVQVVKLEDGKLAYKQSAIINQQSAIQFNTIVTPRGGQYQLTLADGSLVWLNAASSITFPTSFSGNHREVKITGEAYFEVAHNSQMPFRIKAKDVEVQVLGTHFNINAYEDETIERITLKEGSVKIEKNGISKLLKPGQQAQIKTNGNSSIRELDKEEMDEIVAWRDGKFKFGINTDISTIMNQIARWYNVDVEYQGKVNQKFWGSISKDVNLSQVLRILEATGGVKFQVNGSKILVIAVADSKN